MIICLPPQGTPPLPNTVAEMAHSTHSTQRALRPYRKSSFGFTLKGALQLLMHRYGLTRRPPQRAVSLSGEEPRFGLTLKGALQLLMNRYGLTRQPPQRAVSLSGEEPSVGLRAKVRVRVKG